MPTSSAAVPSPSASARRPLIHPLIVRITHWINAGAIIIMIMSGLEIHNAYPTLPFKVPRAITLGGWLGGATQWHFAAMLVLMMSGLIYVTYGFLFRAIQTQALAYLAARSRGRCRGGAFRAALARGSVCL